MIGFCQIRHGDSLEVLELMEDESINCCVTSPPYWGLRDYGKDGQIGLEPTPDQYVEKLVMVFREVRRVLRGDGTLWLNLGDSYGATGGDTHAGFNERWSGTGGGESKQNQAHDGVKNRKLATGVLAKNLLGIPWRVAFALQADGWYLRQDIIWHKPNPMPESVTDRCTKAHEYIFLLSKSARYYYDHKASMEPVAPSTIERLSQPSLCRQVGSERVPFKTNGNMKAVGRVDLRNRRSVWTVTTKPYKGAHFATFPPDLIEPCILAGCPMGGTVLDPFGGSGTTGQVAIENNRNAILIELNEQYIELARQRITDVQPKLAMEEANKE